MNKIKRYIVAASGFALPFATFAEGEQAGASDLGSWVATATGKMGTWATDLAPLFTTGITIVLLIVAWRLFKRTTKAAS